MLLHDPSVCVFMHGQATESRWVFSFWFKLLLLFSTKLQIYLVLSNVLQILVGSSSSLPSHSVKWRTCKVNRQSHTELIHLIQENTEMIVVDLFINIESKHVFQIYFLRFSWWFLMLVGGSLGLNWQCCTHNKLNN